MELSKQGQNAAISAYCANNRKYIGSQKKSKSIAANIN
jgi:hypothetical protein